MFRILCIDDSSEILLILKRTLAPPHEVVCVCSLQEAREALARGPYDLVVLDIGLPDGDGLRFCSELKNAKEYKTPPVFILSSNQSIHEKTLGFQLGIEDFVVKPFEPLELRVRIESRLKKISEQHEQENVRWVGLLCINSSRQRVSLALPQGEITLDLSSTEFKLLSFLAKNPEQVKSREQMIAVVWGDGFHLSDRTVDSHLSRIRKKIKKSDCLIEAVPNAGYRLSLKQKKAA